MVRRAIDPRLPGLLEAWFARNARDFPWRRDSEPYHVWLSEVMLQQTRAEAVVPYYNAFLAEIPDIPSLASADAERLLKLWEGLGYYSRARNLQKAARLIMSDFGGVFPADHRQILSLPGVGPYTAGAIMSICFDSPCPAVDGNVLRVIARITADDGCVSDSAVKKRIGEELARVYPRENCGVFTQSLMELGATVCIPSGSPRCGICPADGLCAAREEGTAALLPVRAKRPERRRRELTVLVCVCDGKTAIRRRGPEGLLGGMWEFPHLDGHLSPARLESEGPGLGLGRVSVLQCDERVHAFTHLEWDMRLCCLSCERQSGQFTWVSPAELRDRYPLGAAFRLPERFLPFLEAPGSSIYKLSTITP